MNLHREAGTATKPQTQSSSGAHGQLVVVGSRRRAKVEATKRAFEEVWPHERWDVIGIDVPSMLSGTPLSESEAFMGALARADLAIGEPRRPAFGVGIEGGVSRMFENWVWRNAVVIKSKDGGKSVGATIGVPMDDSWVLRMQGADAETLGEICNAEFGRRDSDRSASYIGHMTNGALDRVENDKAGIIAALTRFAKPHVFTT